MGISQRKTSDGKQQGTVVRFGKEQSEGADHLLGVEEVGYLLQMIEVSTHEGKHLDVALKCKLKLKAKLNNMMKIKE